MPIWLAPWRMAPRVVLVRFAPAARLELAYADLAGTLGGGPVVVLVRWRQQLGLSWPMPIWLAPKGAGPSGGRSSFHRPMVGAAARGALEILTNLRVGWSGRVGGSA